MPYENLLKIINIGWRWFQKVIHPISFRFENKKNKNTKLTESDFYSSNWMCSLVFLNLTIFSTQKRFGTFPSRFYFVVINSKCPFRYIVEKQNLLKEFAPVETVFLSGLFKLYSKITR